MQTDKGGYRRTDTVTDRQIQTHPSLQRPMLIQIQILTDTYGYRRTQTDTDRYR